MVSSRVQHSATPCIAIIYRIPFIHPSNDNNVPTQHQPLPTTSCNSDPSRAPASLVQARNLPPGALPQIPLVPVPVSKHCPRHTMHASILRETFSTHVRRKAHGNDSWFRLLLLPRFRGVGRMRSVCLWARDAGYRARRHQRCVTQLWASPCLALSSILGARARSPRTSPFRLHESREDTTNLRLQFSANPSLCMAPAP